MSSEVASVGNRHLPSCGIGDKLYVFLQSPRAAMTKIRIRAASETDKTCQGPARNATGGACFPRVAHINNNFL